MDLAQHIINEFNKGNIVYTRHYEDYHYYYKWMPTAEEGYDYSIEVADLHESTVSVKNKYQVQEIHEFCARDEVLITEAEYENAKNLAKIE